jgi:hypothetical protein
MRPPGDIRNAARRAAWEASAGGTRALTWRDLCEHLRPQQVAARVVKYTFKHMLEAGDLQPAQLVRVPGVSRALRSAVPVPPGAPRQARAERVQQDCPFKALDQALFGGGRRR